jgi:hypothetical protein
MMPLVGESSERDEWMKRTGPFFPMLVAYKLQTALPVARDLALSPEDSEQAAAWWPVVALVSGLVLSLLAEILLQGALVPALSGTLLAVLAFSLTGGLTDRSLAITAARLWRNWGADSSEVGDDLSVPSGTLLGLVLARTLILISTSTAAWPGVLLATLVCGRLAALTAVMVAPVGARTSADVAALARASFVHVAAVSTLAFVVAVGFVGLPGFWLLPVVALIALVGRWLVAKLGGLDSSAVAALVGLAELLLLLIMAVIYPTVASPFVAP